MRQRLIRLILLLGLVAGASIAGTGSAYAASYAACIDANTQQYQSGEHSNDTSITGIAAQLNPSHLFHMCTPPETSVTDQNASVMQINITETDGGPSFLTLGVIMCDGPSIPVAPAFCDGYPGYMRYYAEFQNCTGTTLGSYGQRDLGPADFEAHSYAIAHNNNQWEYSIDGLILTTVSDTEASCLDPDTGQQVKGQWMVETTDRADGLGTSAYVSRIKWMQIRNGLTTWSFENPGVCDHTSSQHVAVCSDTNKQLDAYTNN